MLHTLVRDLRQAARRLGRRKVASAAMVLTVALVTGAGTPVAAFINATIVRPLPYPDAERLVTLFTLPQDAKTAADRTPLHALGLLRFRERLRRADAVEGAWQEDKIVSAAPGAEPVSVPAARVSPGFLAMFGARPMLGRLWTPAEDLADVRLCVISHGLWQRMFGGDAGVIGRHIAIDRATYEIAGVLQPGFKPTYVPSDLWTPLVMRMESLPAPKSAFIAGFARLAPDATAADLDLEVRGVMRDLALESPATHAGNSGGAGSLRLAEYGDQRTAAAILAAAVGALALIALANLANVRLARAIAERGDSALRVALGASPWDLVRAQAAEGALVAGAGGLLGVGLARGAIHWLRGIDPRTSAVIGAVPIDWRVLAAAIMLALIVAIASGLLPVIREARRDVVIGLSASGRRTTSSRQETRLRRGLVAAEAALALLLLVCGAVFAAAVDRTAHAGVGFDPSNLLVGQIRMPAPVYPTTEARGAFVRAVLERVRAVPGVAGASTTLNPFVPGNGSYTTGIAIDGHPTPDGTARSATFRRVSDQYFDVMRVPILRGRAIGAEDRFDSQPVAVVSQSFATRYWPGEDAIGRRIIRGTQAFTVVGIAGDIEDSGAGAPSTAELFYIPFSQNSASLTGATLVVRTVGDPAALTSAVRAAVLAADPDQPLEKITTLDSFLSASLGPDRFRETLLGVLAALGLVLTALGIYGVTACMVEERTRELGVRLVLGASPRQLSTLVIAGAALTVAIGCVCGFVCAGIATTALPKILPALTTGATPAWSDLWAAAPAVICLIAAALVAAAIPAWRASRADAKEVLR